MKLHFTYSNNEYYGNYQNSITIYHPINKNINNVLVENKLTLKSIIAIIMNKIKDEEEKNKLSNLYVDLATEKDNLINLFDCIEIHDINNEMLEKINNLILNKKVSIIINLTNIDKEYIIDNIDKIDIIFKEHNLKYKIGQLENEVIFQNSNEVINYLKRNKLKIKSIN